MTLSPHEEMLVEKLLKMYDLRIVHKDELQYSRCIIAELDNRIVRIYIQRFQSAMTYENAVSVEFKADHFDTERDNWFIKTTRYVVNKKLYYVGSSNVY
ncbi:hypothetical protein POP12_187 [Pectobacterium phage POP12]|nr:hypothetical protein POP12_187 [Pectobacterium phage POP12]